MQKTKILSCVGKRALAVIMPIHTLLKSRTISADRVEVILICTAETVDIGKSCGEWLQTEFPGIVIPEPLLFDSECKFLKDLLGSDDIVYLNTNPAMRWEISRLCLYLPQNTICISSDNDYCYIWELAKDIKTAKQLDLKNIGLKAYLKLSDKIDVRVKNVMNTTLSEDLKKCLSDFSFGKSFVISKPGVPLLQRINQRLIWLKESKGSLYLLFDMMKDTETVKLLDDFRLITSVFDPVNYTVTIVSGNSRIIERAKMEGVDYIRASDRNMWQNDIADWINGRWKIRPKAIVPDSLVHAGPPLTSRTSEAAKTLCVCLGDNIEPTLKAILSHKEADAVILFYDNTSPKMTLLARNTAIIYREKNISLVPTDHKGQGIVDYMTASARTKMQYVINITPGTKTQAVALTAAAILTGFQNEIYSIFRDFTVKKETIRRVADSCDCSNVLAPEVQDLINCLIAPVKSDAAEEKKNRAFLEYEIWTDILRGIVSGKIIPNNSIESLTFTDRHMKIDVLDDNKIHMQGKTYQLDNSFLGKGGTWWEAVVGQAISVVLKDDMHWQMEWECADTKRDSHAEIDVVAKYGNHILAISCKTAKKNITNAAYMIKSEAWKRFGRFAVPFVAVPHEMNKGKALAGSVIDDVTILTPSILNNPEKLVGCFDSSLAALSTRGKPG